MRTNPHYTQTAIGPIPHMPHPDGFDMPVRLVFKPGEPLGNPEALLGSLVYALPGGGRLVAGAMVEA